MIALPSPPNAAAQRAWSSAPDAANTAQLVVNAVVVSCTAATTVAINHSLPTELEGATIDFPQCFTPMIWSNDNPNHKPLKTGRAVRGFSALNTSPHGRPPWGVNKESPCVGWAPHALHEGKPPGRGPCPQKRLKQSPKSQRVPMPARGWGMGKVLWGGVHEKSLPLLDPRLVLALPALAWPRPGHGSERH